MTVAAAPAPAPVNLPPSPPTRLVVPAIGVDSAACSLFDTTVVFAAS